jgi:hypothetical protein
MIYEYLACTTKQNSFTPLYAFTELRVPVDSEAQSTPTTVKSEGGIQPSISAAHPKLTNSAANSALLYLTHFPLPLSTS